jgi:hypothetical protein
MGIRFMVYPHKKSPCGKTALSFGLRLGYWPCMGGPFVSLAIGPVSLDLWYGQPYQAVRA